MDGNKQATWEQRISDSTSAAEKVIAKFPDSDQLGVALHVMLADQESLLDAQLKNPQQIDDYLQKLARRYAGEPSVQSRILFTLATFTYQTNPNQGLLAMNSVYDPSLLYAPADIDLYGTALIAGNRADLGYKIYEKLANDYPLPPGVKPLDARPAIQDAQTTALLGMGSALEKQGHHDDAVKLFAQLKADYPWSPRVVEANFIIAKSLFRQDKLDEASKVLVHIVGSHTATASVRAHAFLLIGDIQTAKGNVPAAIDAYLKTAVFYSGVPDAASEGLWRGGQMLERQAASLSEDSSPKRSVQINRAVNAYKGLVEKYPASPFVSQAEDRLRALGVGV
jgi:outer membrane protein assembly factor BamD (BamD/ComL family)